MPPAAAASGAGPTRRASAVSCAGRGPRAGATGSPGRQRPGHDAVVVRRSPPRAARSGHRHRRAAAARAASRARSARSAGSATKPDSCASKRGMKKLPDCRKSPANASGEAPLGVQHRQAAEADPGAQGRRTATASAMAGRTRVASVRAYSALAEYHSSRSPGARRATRWRRERARGDVRRAVVGEPRELVELGAVVDDEQGQRLVVADAVRAARSRPRARRPARSTRRSGGRWRRAPARRPATPAPRSPAARTTDFSPNAPGARSGLAGSVHCSCPPSARCTSSAYSKRSSAGAGIRSVQPSPSRAKGSAATGKPRSVASRTPASASSGSERRRTIESRSTSGPVAAIGDDTAGKLAGTGGRPWARAPEMRRCPPPLTVRLVGGPTAVLDYARPAPAHRPDLRPARRARRAG